MKKTSLFAFTLVLVMTLIFGSTLPVSAKPIDNGSNNLSMSNLSSQLWQSDSGLFWELIIVDEFSQEIDYLYVRGWDDNTSTLFSNQNFDIPIESNINFKKGIATFTSSVINITIKFQTSTDNLAKYGSRRDGDLSYHFTGYGSITGTVLIDDVTYILDGTFSDDHQLIISSSHSITKGWLNK